MSERLYRDEVGAAVERLTQLEEENAQLRRELDRLTAPKDVAACSRVTAGAMVLLAAILSVASLGLRAGCPERAAAARQARLTASPHARVAPTEFRVIRNGDDCGTPYYYDANGVKRYRASCLGFGEPPPRF